MLRQTNYHLPRVLSLFIAGGLLLVLSSGCGGSGGKKKPIPVTVRTVYFAQSHVMEPTSSYFKLVGSRDTLIQAHVVATGGITAPTVTAQLTLGLATTTITLSGPAILPESIVNGPGKVQHSFGNSFTGTIPKEWLKPGLSVQVHAADSTWTSPPLTIGAPTKLITTMFDFHFFTLTTGDYPAGWEQEFAQKFPVAEMELRRVPNIVMNEVVILPRIGFPALRVSSKEEYKTITGATIDGENSASSRWNRALQAAAGHNRISYYYGNIYGIGDGGVGGGFAGVGIVRNLGIFVHESGHAFSLPHWSNSAAYPYKGKMYGISPRPSNPVHAGPTWAFDMPSMTFIPPTVQSTAVKSGNTGYYKQDPMQGGAIGDQESGFLFSHFSDFSVRQMSNYFEGHVVIWNTELNAYARWNSASGDYTSIVSQNDINLPTVREVDVISVLVGHSPVTAAGNIVYAPIGAYKAGMIRLFDPRVAEDRAAWSVAYPGLTGGCDVCLRVVQGGVEKYFMLPLSTNTSLDPLLESTYFNAAVNLRASDGEITEIDMLKAPDAQTNGLPASPDVLDSWIKPVPAIAN